MDTWVTKDLAAYAVETDLDAYPPEVVAKAKTLIRDNIGCMIGGSRSTLGRAMIDPITRMGGSPDSTLIGTGIRVPVTQAALANGTGGNALDYDDSVAAFGHPGATLTATSLAVGEWRKVSGRRILTAVLTAYDVGVRIARATWPSAGRLNHVQGMGTWPALASAVCAGKLMGFDLDAMLNALGVAGATAPIPNTQKWGWDPEERPIHWVKESTGWPAWCGTMAATLAENGFVGNRFILDGDNGFWIMSGSDQCRWELFTEGLGQVFEIENVEIKPYSACRWQHAALDAVTRLKAEHDIKPDQVKEVVVHSFDWVKRQEIWGPTSMVDAQFCVPHSITMLLHGNPCGPVWYAHETLTDPEVVEYSRRIRVEVDPELEKLYVDETKFTARVEIFLTDGRKVEKYIDKLLGNPDNPMTAAQVEDKFRYLASFHLDEARTDEVVAMIDDLENVADINELTRLF